MPAEPPAASSAEPAVAAQPIFAEVPCEEGLPEHSLCGTVTVFEDRARAAGKTIALRVLVIPAAGEEPSPDPVFLLAGGPGQNASALAGLARAYGTLHASRDFVFVDQRGTGASNGLRCSVGGLQGLLYGPLGPAQVERLDRCREFFDADLSLYSTPLAMDDLDDVRVALGYEQVNLWGASYGTRAGLVYLRRHGEHVRSAVFWGVAPTNHTWPADMAPGAQRVFDELAASCLEDEACSARYGDLRPRFVAVLESLASSPGKGSAFDPQAGKRVEVRIDRRVFMLGIRFALYDVGWSAAVPAMIEEAEHGDFSRFLGFIVPIYQAIMPGISFGMHLSVTCAEDIPFVTAEDRAAAEGTFVGSGLLEDYDLICPTWRPRAHIDSTFREPVESNVPVLLLNGALDPATPPESAGLAARGLSRSRVVVLENTGHITTNARGCDVRLGEAFILNPDPATLDVSCAVGIERPDFAMPAK